MSENKDTAISYGLCLEEDDFLQDKPIWVADLENGLKIYQDDGRPGQEEPIAWKRLHAYCDEQSQNIQSMSLKFRSHIVHIPNQHGCDGYYFSYGAIRDINDSATQMHYVCGTYVSRTDEESLLPAVFCHWYKTPELIHIKTNEKTYDQQDVEKKILILKS